MVKNFIKCFEINALLIKQLDHRQLSLKSNGVPIKDVSLAHRWYEIARSHGISIAEILGHVLFTSRNCSTQAKRHLIQLRNY